MKAELMSETKSDTDEHSEDDSSPPTYSVSELCEYQSRCQPGGKFVAAHHRNCRHYDLEGDAHKVITDLLRGIEASAQDTDGIHPALWEAYKRAKASVREFDWKEEFDD